MRKLRLAKIALVLVAVTGSAPAQTYKVLYNFGSRSGDPTSPWFAQIVQGRDGNLYSTAIGGGGNGDGAMFRVTPAGTLTVLHSFNESDGAGPEGGVTLGTDGNFFGTTSGLVYSAGTFVKAVDGTVFKMTAAGSLTTLINFYLPGAFDPATPPIEGIDGNFCGSTPLGGGASACLEGCGTEYKITPSGTFTTLHNMSPQSDGAVPTALVQGTGGNLYGATGSQGRLGGGTVFEMSPSGRLFKTLFNFGTTNAESPIGVIQGADGDLYGTTRYGGPNGNGVVFKLTRSGTLTVLYVFGGDSEEGSPSSLTQAADWNFYGTTRSGGSPDCGTIFRITPAGSFATLFTFPGDGSMGCLPLDVPLQRRDGRLYGTTNNGGIGNNDGGCSLASI